MKAILWKEFRENAKWGVLGLVGMLVAVAFVLAEGYWTNFWRGSASIFEMQVLFLFASSGICLALGLLQTALEVRRDQWAFLMHRGVSSTHIFLGKTIAGLTIYAVVMSVPLLVVAACYAWWSPEHFPFDWRTLKPLALYILSATGFYFAAMLVAIRQARFYVSRLLPLVLPGLAVFGAAMFASEFTENIPAWMFLASLALVAVTALAAWGTFIRSGESEGLPTASQFSLGTSLTVALQTGIICVVVLGIWFADEVLKWSPTFNERVYGYSVTREGHIVRTEHDAHSRRNSWKPQVIDIVDLDDPDSQKYKSSVGQPTSDIGKRLDESPMATIWYRTEGLGVQFFRLGGSRRLVENVYLADGFNWLYSHKDGLIYGYDTHLKDNQREKPQELAWVVGPDGYSIIEQSPQNRFGRAVTIGPSLFARNRFMLGTRETRGNEIYNREFLVFEEGIYEIDYSTHSVQKVYDAPDGKPIRSVAPIDNERFGVVFADALHIHKAKSVVAGETVDYQTHERDKLRVELPGEFIEAIPIPEAVRKFDRFEVGQLANNDVVVFRCSSAFAMPDFLLTRFVTMKKDGTVLEVRDLPDGPPAGVFRTSTWAVCAIACCIPMGFALIASLVDALTHIMSGTGPGLVVRILQYDPLAMAAPLVVMFFISVACALIARRTARKYGFTKSESRWWIVMAALLEPAGLLALYCLRPWPVREPCHMCGEPRPVDLPTCPICNNPPEPVHRDGTEILQDAAAMAV